MDVDIDLPSTFDPLDYFDQAVRASRVRDGELVKHPAGAYLQHIPTDQKTKLAAIPYKQAEQFGFFKIDFLHLTLLDHFDNKQQIRQLSRKAPDWSLLRQQDVVEKLFQIHRHFDLIQQIQPNSISTLADCIALIRPGKRILVDRYIKNPDHTRHELYSTSKHNKANFKRSHSIAYAVTIVLQLHLFEAQIV